MDSSFTLTDITEFTRHYLAIFYSFVALFYTLRIVFLTRATAKEVVFPGRPYCNDWWNHLAFRIFRVTIWWVCLARLFYPQLDYYLGLFYDFQHPIVIVTGVALLTSGFLMTILVHFAMGSAWRSGIDPNRPTKLITSGMYQYSRNPMFVFVAIAQWGFFLALPSCFSLLCLIIGHLALYRQVREEEKHLSVLFPQEFVAYTQKVRRWV
ncbi:methyltransferase family protein [Planctobacterium marinum]|uniref:Isoprenylcysteine carboxylmethyltransferase family protein n=1 Tax=Planctobacterium marinum TaxID=1631968 RepID=A0AA48KSW3_9ALTE|nr:hypothetical protein MACH26_24250 [Planctobacterium marinum]